MITCESFRTRFAPATEDASLLEHLRACDRCLDHAAGIDPDVMFRALGGSDLVPPGGIDAFVDDVMRQVRVREAESSLVAHKPVLSWTRRLAVAATIAAGITGTLLVQKAGAPSPELVTPLAVARLVSPLPAQKLATKPVVETYESQNATIVEVPDEEAGDQVKMVMIFDESLPVDL